MSGFEQYFSKRIRGLQPYTPGFQPPPSAELIKLNTNENPYPPSPRSLEAIRELLDARLRRYPPPQWDHLRNTLARAYGTKAEQIFCGNGSDEILALAFRCFTDPGDRVLLTDPTYSLYPVLAALAGVSCRTVPTRDGDFSVPFDALAAEGERIAFIANPNAPTGRLEALPPLSAFVNDFPGVVIVDEAYIDFADHPEKATALNLIEQHPNLLVTRTFSKAFSLCGLRVGYAFGQAHLIDALLRAKDSYNLDLLAQAGAAAAIADMDWMRQQADKVRRTRKNSARELETRGFTVLPSQANFLFVRHKTRDAREMHQALAARHIHVRHFPLPGLDNYLRISIGSDQEMEALFRTLDEVLA